jgi:hypothetical protein
MPGATGLLDRRFLARRRPDRIVAIPHVSLTDDPTDLEMDGGVGRSRFRMSLRDDDETRDMGFNERRASVVGWPKQTTLPDRVEGE